MKELPVSNASVTCGLANSFLTYNMGLPEKNLKTWSSVRSSFHESSLANSLHSSTKGRTRQTYLMIFQKCRLHSSKIGLATHVPTKEPPWRSGHWPAPSSIQYLPALHLTRQRLRASDPCQMIYQAWWSSPWIITRHLSTSKKTRPPHHQTKENKCSNNSKSDSLTSPRALSLP